MFDDIATRLEHIPPKLLKKMLSGIVWEGTLESGTMAITFDDGPDPDVTPAVLDACDEAGIRATFFMLGGQVTKYPALAREVYERGHCIGCHSMTHRSLFLAGRREIEGEIKDSLAAIHDATGVRARWFRPPYGLFDHTCISVVKELGLTMVIWTVLAGDYSDDAPEKVLDRIDRYIAPGAIIVFHDTRGGGGVALPGIVHTTAERARERNVRAGGIDDLSLMVEMALDESDCDE